MVRGERQAAGPAPGRPRLSLARAPRPAGSDDDDDIVANRASTQTKLAARKDRLTLG